MLVEYAVVELDPELEPMLGQRCAPECCCDLGVVVDGADGVGLAGVGSRLLADQATLAPIVSAAMTATTITSFIRTMATSFRSPLKESTPA